MTTPKTFIEIGMEEGVLPENINTAAKFRNWLNRNTDSLLMEIGREQTLATFIGECQQHEEVVLFARSGHEDDTVVLDRSTGKFSSSKSKLLKMIPEDVEAKTYGFFFVRYSDSEEEEEGTSSEEEEEGSEEEEEENSSDDEDEEEEGNSSDSIDEEEGNSMEMERVRLEQKLFYSTKNPKNRNYYFWQWDNNGNTNIRGAPPGHRSEGVLKNTIFTGHIFTGDIREKPMVRRNIKRDFHEYLHEDGKYKLEQPPPKKKNADGTILR